ncbi:MAG: DUF6531 domain-containing protein, partial [Clostridiales bacterium]
MGDIYINYNGMWNVYRALCSMKDNIKIIETSVGFVLNNLDNEALSKNRIGTNLESIKKRIEKSAEKIDNMSNYVKDAIDNYQETDKKYKKKLEAGFLEKFWAYIYDLKEDITDLFTDFNLTSATSVLFSPLPIVLKSTIITSALVVEGIRTISTWASEHKEEIEFLVGIAKTISTSCLAGITDKLKDCWNFIADPINNATGNFVTIQSDLIVNGVTPLVFKRSYNSIDVWNGSLGTNWHHNFEVCLKLENNSFIKITHEDGRTEVYESIDKNNYENKERPGRTLKYFEGEYILKLENETKYIFNFKGKLKYIEDVNNNKIELIYIEGNLIKVQNKCGFLEFEYIDNKIVKVKDCFNRSIEYSYDEKERLVCFKNTEGNDFKYTYFDNFIKEMIDELDNKIVENHYDSIGKVLKQNLADNSTTRFQYDDFENTVTFTDRNKTKTIFRKDSKNRIFEEEYNDGKIIKEFDRRDNKTVHIDKLGNRYLYEYDDKGKLIKEIDPQGNKKSYTYYKNKISSFINEEGAVYKFEYDEKGNITKSIDPLNREIKYKFNKIGLIEKFFFPDKTTTSAVYNKKGNLEEIHDQENDFIKFEYNELNKLSAITDQNGNTRRFEFGLNDQIEKIIFPDNSTRYIKYNKKKLPIEYIDVNGMSAKIIYNLMGNVSEIINEAGYSKKFMYNEMGEVSTIIREDGEKISFEYNENNKISSVKDYNGNKYIYKYDLNGNIVKTVNPLGSTRQFKYDELNRIVEVINGNGASTKLEYSKTGKIRKVINDLNQVIEYEYDSAGQIKTYKDREGNITKYNFDIMGNISSVVYPNGVEIKYEFNKKGKISKIIYPDDTFDKFLYDKKGNLTKYVSHLGVESTCLYNNMDRLIQIIDGEWNYQKIDYNNKGEVIKISDNSGIKFEYEYDLLGNLVKVIDGNGNKTEYKYNIINNLTQIHRYQKSKEASNFSEDEVLNELITKFVYNKNGQITKEIDESGNVTEYVYDENGNLIENRDREGNSTKFAYDPENNIKSMIYGDGRKAEFTYNSINNLIKVDDWFGTSSIKYNNMGRVTEYCDFDNKKIQYAWDALNQKTKIVYPDGDEINYKYDSIGRIEKIIHDKDELIYKYKKSGYLDNITYPNGVKREYEFNYAADITKAITYSKDGNIMDELEYKYDEYGNKINKIENGINTQYKYDNLNFLTEEILEDGQTQKYIYDSLGNITKIENLKNGTIEKVKNFKYNNSSQLDEIVEGNFVKNFNYDKRGNLKEITENGVITSKYLFGANNRLAGSDHKNNKNLYKYDGLGRRVFVNDEKHYPDITNPRYNSLLMIEKDNDLVKNVFGYGSSAEFSIENSTNNFYIKDSIGNPRLKIDPNGDIVNKYKFSSFGEGNSDKNIGFTGFQQDDNSNLLFAQARYYMPEIGRFISEDSYKGNAVNPSTLNKYMYCFNNPMRFVDPTGFLAGEINDFVVDV